MKTLSGKTVETIPFKLHILNICAWDFFFAAMVLTLGQGHDTT